MHHFTLNFQKNYGCMPPDPLADSLGGSRACSRVDPLHNFLVTGMHNTAKLKNRPIYILPVSKIGLLEISYPGEFVPRRIRTQNDWVRILWLIRTRVRIIQRIRTLYISFILIIYNICKLYLCFIP